MSGFNRSLGITIPTYRRPEWLRASVRSIIEPAKLYNVPIFVADDSADETNLGVIAELQQEYSNVFHVRNEVNLGIDRNIIKSIQICECDYVWPLGEDDLMRSGAVGEVLGALDGIDRRASFAFVNYTLLNEDYSAVLRERFAPIRTDTVVPSEEFLARWAWAIGFIGACIINRRLWDGVDPSPYLDTYWAHVGVIMESIRGRNVLMIAKPLVLKRIGSPKVFSWSDSTFDVVEGWADLMSRLVPIYGEQLCRDGARSFERVFGLFGRFLIYARGEGLYDAEGFRRHVQGTGRGAFYVAGAWLIARMPRSLARLIVRVSRSLRMVWQRAFGAVRPPRRTMNLP